MQKLTAKQELFVQGLISGMSQSEAYKQAYPNTRMKDKTIREAASRLMRNSNVIATYNELMDEHKQKALWTREQASMELLALLEEAKNDLRETGLTNVSKSALIDAIRELNKIEGINTTREEQRELLKAQTEHIKAKTKLIVGAEHDMSLMQTLADVLTEKTTTDGEPGEHASYDDWLNSGRSVNDGEEL